MTEETKPVSIAPEDILDRGVDHLAGAGKEAIGTVVPGVSSQPSKPEESKPEETKTGEKTDDGKKEDKAAA